MKVSRGIIEINLKDGNSVYRQALICEGLAVHLSSDKSHYTVSHVQSGLAVDRSSRPTLADAKARMLELLTVEGYWLLSLSEIQASLQVEGSHRDKVRRAVGLDKVPVSLGSDALAMIAAQSAG